MDNACKKEALSALRILWTWPNFFVAMLIDDSDCFVYGCLLRNRLLTSGNLMLCCLDSHVSRPGTFKLSLTFSEDYPNKAPVVSWSYYACLA